MSLSITSFVTTHVSSGTNAGDPPLARIDIYNALTQLNNWMSYFGNTTGSGASGAGFVMFDSSSRAVFGANFNADYNGGSPKINLTTTAYVWWDAANSLFKLNISGTDYPFITSSSGGIALSNLATQAANTLVGNSSGSTTTPAAVTLGNGLKFIAGSLAVSTVAVDANATAAQTGMGSFTILAFANKTLDTDTAFSTSTNKFTAPRTANYKISAMFPHLRGQSNPQLRVAYNNGSTTSYLYSGTGGGAPAGSIVAIAIERIVALTSGWTAWIEAIGDAQYTSSQYNATLTIHSL